MEATKVQPGTGGTVNIGSDSYAVTVIRSTASRVWVQRDIATRTDSNGMSDQQAYSYQPNPTAEVEVYSFNKRIALWVRKGHYFLHIGKRSEFRDFTF